MSTGRKPAKRKLSDEKPDKVYDFHEEVGTKENSGSEDEIREEDSPIAHKLPKKRVASAPSAEEKATGVGEVQSMLERFGVDISKVMQAKKKRLESLTKNYMKGSQDKLEQLWNNHHTQRQKMTQLYSQQVDAALQQWETEAQRRDEQEEQLNDLFRQQQKVLQQARVMQNQKLKKVRKLYEQFVKMTEDMEKTHESFLQGAQQELKKEMNTLQKKVLMEMHQQEMATVRKSLQSMLF
ncbi:synaptonemal complex protein 3 isoform X2 [Cynoglossus semilaevis]|uniref:synaptonemal complex protein 3 isoform X2 n=1 Tax=Cynoglossus semilaevis TaxID=244447 RepID=UPI00049608E1|nr:synaptonemal complex protein 3 isoform X2 [Cynoglossus semilaevis]